MLQVFTEHETLQLSITDTAIFQVNSACPVPQWISSSSLQANWHRYFTGQTLCPSPHQQY